MSERDKKAGAVACQWWASVEACKLWDPGCWDGARKMAQRGGGGRCQRPMRPMRPGSKRVSADKAGKRVDRNGDGSL